MSRLVSNSRWVFLLLLALGALALGNGCATDSENLSERPWSTPQSWENGIPSSMYDQYR